MFRKHPIFPKVPRGFWRRFRSRWNPPLRLLEEVITLAESLGADSESQRFETMDEEYCFALRNLHSRTCLHARGVLSLLHYGLVDPAWVLWRACHETATIAEFISDRPETAHRYLRHSVANKYHMADVLSQSKHPEAPSEEELDRLRNLATSVLSQLESEYGRATRPRDYYAWSGLQNFSEIEESVFSGAKWNPRANYIYASWRVHSSPVAGEPIKIDDHTAVLPVGPINAGLTGPADLTSLSIMRSTLALTAKAAITTEDEDTLALLTSKGASLGALCWTLDPSIHCDTCGGFVPGASPPEILTQVKEFHPCSCPRS